MPATPVKPCDNQMPRCVLLQGNNAVPPSDFERFSNEPPNLAHVAMLARCIMNPNCAENLDEEGNKLVTPNAAVWKETLTHLEDADEIIRRVTRLKFSTLRPAKLCPGPL